MIDLAELLDYDFTKKTGKEGYDRAKRIVRYLRQSAKPIVSSEIAIKNRKILYSTQDMEEIRKIFLDPDNCGVQFLQFAVMERIRNVLTAEQEDIGLLFQLKSTDLTAVNEKQRDAELIANRGWIEPVQSHVNALVGLPPFNMLEQKDLFNGNVAHFDKLGLDSSNDEDLNYFFQQHYRLAHEMAGEEPINYFIKYNNLSDMIPAWYADIMAVKMMSLRTYVNEVSGAIDYKYIRPECIKAIEGVKPDLSDGDCILYEDSMTISDMIKMLGNEFDFQRDMDIFLRAVNYSNKTNYTGILDGTNLKYGTLDRGVQFSTFLRFYVSVGYIEWKEIDASTHAVGRNPTTGKLNVKPVGFNYEPSKTSFYSKDVKYYETTYKAYYLDYGLYEAELFKYGKLNYMEISGSEDEYSGFSIIVNREVGKSVVEIAIPMITILEKSLKKMEFMINKAKMPGRMWNFESLTTIAKHLFPKAKPHEQVFQLMAKFSSMSDEIYAIPTVNGQPVGGGGAMNYDLPHGLSQMVPQLQGIVDWCTVKIMDQIGISPLRATQQPSEKDGLGLSEQANNYSEKATAYMPKMVSKTLERIGIRTLGYVQDIIQFKDKSTVPYKFILQALGDKTMEELAALNKVSFHRYNIFVEGYVSSADRREQVMMVQAALQKGEIDYAQYLLIRNTSSPKKAIEILAYQKKLNERNAQKQAQQAQEGQQQLEDMRHKNKMEEIDAEGTWGVRRETERGKYLVQSKQVEVEGSIEKQNNKLAAEPDILEKKQQGNIAQDMSRSLNESSASMLQ